jgi:hypothetical protein
MYVKYQISKFKEIKGTKRGRIPPWIMKLKLDNFDFPNGGKSGTIQWVSESLAIFHWRRRWGWWQSGIGRTEHGWGRKGSEFYP